MDRQLCSARLGVGQGTVENVSYTWIWTVWLRRERQLEKADSPTQKRQYWRGRRRLRLGLS